MKKKVGQVVSRRVQPVQFIVKHEREPCERMPVSHMVICECPGNGRCSKSFLDMGIVNDVFVIVIVYELMIFYLPESDESGDGQEKTDEDNPIF
jgi:hypothetical protein